VGTNDQARSKGGYSKEHHLHRVCIGGSKTKGSGIEMVFFVDVLVEPGGVEEPMHPIMEEVFPYQAQCNVEEVDGEGGERELVSHVEEASQRERDTSKREDDQCVVGDQVLDASNVILFGGIFLILDFI